MEYIVICLLMESRHSEINSYPMCFRSISNNFLTNNMENTGLHG